MENNGEKVAQEDGNQKTKARLLGAGVQSDPAGEEIEYANYEQGVCVSEYVKGTTPEERSGHLIQSSRTEVLR